MQVLLLGLFVAVFLHDATVTATQERADGSLRVVEALPADSWPHLGPLPVIALVLGPKLLLALVYQTACLRTRRKLGSAGGQSALNGLERLTSALPLILLLLFAVDLSAGGLRVVRLVLRHTVLIDEFIVLLPTLGVVVLSWWSYYPVDRRLREAVIFRHADAGRPVYPIPTRAGYLSSQIRHQFGLLLLPLLAVFGWVETVALLGLNHRGVLDERGEMLLTPVGVLTVFIFSPLIIRHVWQTVPLAAGEVRERMAGLCKLHGIRVRELLLWQTGGGLINAAVTGLIPRVRYILLSDGLLDQLHPRSVEAVMAHEIAHVKLRHMIWMGVILVASLGIIEMSAQLAFIEWLLPILGNNIPLLLSERIGLDVYDQQSQTLVIAVPVFALTLLVFGWVSRRIERQADVFAARHMARVSDAPMHDAQGRQVFDEAAIGAMVHALQRVAELNHSPTTRKSWRHGSIAWRQQYLRSLVGTPLEQAGVDRVLMRVKIAALLALAWVMLISWQGGVDLSALAAA